MHDTRLLRRVIHYIWECFRERGEMKIRVRSDRGDELHVEEHGDNWLVTVRYSAKQPTGELVKQVEVVCFIMRYGEWVPLQLFRVDSPNMIYATADAENGAVSVVDHAGQLQAVGFCDAWALRFLEEGFLASAAKLNPLGPRAHQRPNWPTPTVPVPTLEQIEEWLWEDGGCETTDGCWCEPDGTCPHSHPSWLLRLGLT